MTPRNTSLAKRTAGYERFLKSVKLVTIALDNISGSLERERYWSSKEKEKKKRPVRLIDAEYEASSIGPGHFNVIGKTLLAIKDDGEESPILVIACQYTAHFHAAGVTKEKAERFANSEAKIIVWPYFRQIVSDISGRMYIPPIIVPLSLES